MDVKAKEEQQKKDKRIKGVKIRFNIWNKEQKENAINKLPNELRTGEKDWNTNNIYQSDSYCGLYAED